MDRGKAKRLLAEAGYPAGFRVTFDCPNSRYLNDDGICTSVAAMLAQIGIQAPVNALPQSVFFPKHSQQQTANNPQVPGSTA